MISYFKLHDLKENWIQNIFNEVITYFIAMHIDLFKSINHKQTLIILFIHIRKSNAILQMYSILEFEKN